MKNLANIALLFVLFPTIFFGFNKENFAYNKEKNISKTYIVNDDVQANITNSYGNVNVYLWDENKISIQVNIKVSGSNEKKIDERINSIDVDFLATVSKVTAKTLFTTKEWKSNNISYEINYTVKIPRNGSVDLTNKYGNISIEKLNGSANISCRYGSLFLGQMNNRNNTIEIAYSQNSTINYIDKLNLKSQYSDVDFQKVNQIDIDGNYNTFDFQNIGNMEVSSNYSKINAKNINKVSIDGNYLTLKLGEISNAVDINSNYSDIRFSATNKVNSITINGNYTNSKINFDADFDFNFNINLGYGSLKDDLGLKFTQKSEKNNSKTYSGYHLNNSKSALYINTNYGSVQLLNK